MGLFSVRVVEKEKGSRASFPGPKIEAPS